MSTVPSIANDDYIEKRIRQYAQYAITHKHGIITHHEILQTFSQDCEVDEERLAGDSDFSCSVGSFLLQMGWREMQNGNGYEFPEQINETPIIDRNISRRQSELVHILGVEAGAHDW